MAASLLATLQKKSLLNDPRLFVPGLRKPLHVVFGTPCEGELRLCLVCCELPTLLADLSFVLLVAGPTGLAGRRVWFDLGIGISGSERLYDEQELALCLGIDRAGRDACSRDGSGGSESVWLSGVPRRC